MMREWIINAMARGLLVASMVAFLSCSGSTNSSRNGLDVEAEKKAQEYLERTVTRCGEGDYTKALWAERFYGNLVQERALFQLKSPSHFIKAIPLTPADELNGVEWRGTLDIRAVAHRRYDETARRWGEWRDGVPERTTNREVAMPSLIGLADGAFYKKNGRWSTDEMDELFEERKPVCSEIPPG